MYNKQASGQQGFTLVELLIVIAIIAIVASVAVPSMTNFVNKNRVKRAAEEVYGLVTRARAESVIRDADIFLSVSGGENWCVGYAVAAGCDCGGNTCTVPVAGAPAVTQVVSGASFDGAVDISGDFNGGASFDAVKGTSSSSSVTLSSTDDKWKLSVAIGRVGRVRICAHADSESTMGFVTCQ